MISSNRNHSNFGYGFNFDCADFNSDQKHYNFYLTAESSRVVRESFPISNYFIRSLAQVKVKSLLYASLS